MKMLRIFAILLGCILSSNIALAQLSCDECPENWSDTLSQIVCFGPPGASCCVQYTYTTRAGCGAQEIQILEMIVTSDGGGCSFGQMLKESFQHLILTNRMGFEPSTPGQCAVSWRVTAGSCWNQITRINTSGGTEVAYWPCPETECCYQYYKVCKTNSGAIIEYYAPGSVPQNNCPVDCPYYSCLPISNLGGPPNNGTKSVLGSSSTEYPVIGAVLPNPTTGLVTLDITASRAGDLLLVVAASNGDVVLENRLNIDGPGRHTISADLKSLASGTYHYVLKQEEAIVSGGQINIAR